MRRFQAMLLSLFSLLAVLLAAVGIFGLMGQLVVRRTSEIVLRMALGATPEEVLKMVLLQGVRWPLLERPAFVARSSWRVCSRVCCSEWAPPTPPAMRAQLSFWLWRYCLLVGYPPGVRLAWIRWRRFATTGRLTAPLPQPAIAAWAGRGSAAQPHSTHAVPERS